MAALLDSIKKSIRQMNRISRVYIKYGNALVFSALCAFLFCCMIMGKIGNYDNLLYLRGELFILLRDMICAVYVPSILIEIIKIASKSDIIN